ncbi:MAG: hypothetical protein EOL88_02295 [Bacteroidia bacterium]|nr:hypothetical protein [Bacteroidia bacterium]
MYNATTIKTGFSGLLGISNPRKPIYPRVPTDLQGSESGLYLNTDFHPIATIENIYYATENIYQYADEYVVGTYNTGEIVKYGDYSYTSLEDGNTETPGIEATKWEWTVYTEMRGMLNKSYVTVVRNFLQELKLIGSTKGIFSDLRIFDRSGKYSDEVVKRGGFVGLRIATHSAIGLQLAIPTIGIQLNTAQDSLMIYCYHSSKDSPVFTFEMTDIQAKEFTWFNLNEVISGNSMEYDSGGYFYIGYYEEDIIGNAINRKYDFSRTPCKGCINQTYDYISYRQWSKYYNICSFYVIDINDDRTLFNIGDVVEQYDNNYGLNISVSVQCDISDYLVENRGVFSDAIGISFSCDVMKLIESCTRGNNITDRLRNYASAELRGVVSDLGYMQNLNKSVKSIKIDFSALNSPCFGSGIKGIKYGYI